MLLLDFIRSNSIGLENFAKKQYTTLAAKHLEPSMLTLCPVAFVIPPVQQNAATSSLQSRFAPLRYLFLDGAMKSAHIDIITIPYRPMSPILVDFMLLLVGKH